MSIGCYFYLLFTTGQLYNSIHSQHIALAPSARDALDLVSNADCWCAIFGSNVKLEYDVISEPGLYLTLI